MKSIFDTTPSNSHTPVTKRFFSQAHWGPSKRQRWGSCYCLQWKDHRTPPTEPWNLDLDSALWPRVASYPLVPILVCLKKSMRREFQNFTNILKPELQWTSRRFTIQEIFSEETRQKPPESSVHTRRATSRTTPCTWGWCTFLPVGKMKSMDRPWTRVKNPSDDRNAAKRAILLLR